MKFSVIIPCHNAATWIGQALQSVADQRHPAHEVIVVDDGSTDDSVQQVQNASLPVRLVQHSFGSASRTRNHGAGLATGDWLAFLDADDYWYPDHLQRAATLTGPDDVAFLGHIDHITADGKPWPHRSHHLPPEPRSGQTQADFLRMYCQAVGFPGMSACIVQRQRFQEIGGLDENFPRRHDIEFWLRLIDGQTFTMDAVASSAYRADVASSLSRNATEAAVYRLHALARHEPSYRSPEMHWLLRHAARRAVARTIANRGHQDCRAVWNHASPWLTFTDRVLLRPWITFPAPLAQAMRWRRRLFYADAPDNRAAT